MNTLFKNTIGNFVFLLMLSGLSLLANASIDVYEFENETTREEFVSLTKELRCPKCQNQDIADSNAPIAADMRKEVHRLLQEGKDRESIIDHMIERFGDFVTYKPRLSAETFMLWYGPWLFVIVGLLIIATMIRMKKPTSKNQTDSMGSEASMTDRAVQGSEQASHTKAEKVYSSEVKKLLDKYDDQGTDNRV